MIATEPPVLHTARLVLDIPNGNDAVRTAEFYQRNREHLAPWEPVHAPNLASPELWMQHLPNYSREFLANLSLRLALRLASDPEGQIIGFIHFTNFALAAAMSVRLGYNLDARYEGQGYMSEALRAGCRYVFDELGFHRIEAGYMPTNVRSARLLRKLGFDVEGYARDYLFIAGMWRDHVLLALTNPAHATTGGV